jgi:hypothetical protein
MEEVQALHTLTGNDMSHVVVVFTHGDRLQSDSIETLLQSCPDVLKNLLRVRHFPLQNEITEPVSFINDSSMYTKLIRVLKLCPEDLPLQAVTDSWPFFVFYFHFFNCFSFIFAVFISFF